MKKYIIAITLFVALGVQAQEVSTLYFLENAPMRHLVNPAFQPVSKGYVNFTPLGYSSIWAGNSAFTLSDFIYAAPNGSTVTVFHPEYGKKDDFLKSLPSMVYSQQDATLNWLGFGFRIKEKGYFTFQAMMRVDSKESFSTSIFPFLLNGSSATPSSSVSLNLGKSNLATQVYTEIGGGYSHKINDIWTVGGKLKLLLGTAYIGSSFSQMDITGSAQKLGIKGQGDMRLAGPLNFAALPSQLSYKAFGMIDLGALMWMNEGDVQNIIQKFTKPSGYGAAIDLGFTATPLKQLQISVGLNDLGFIYWNNGTQYAASVDTSFAGISPSNYSDFIVDGQLVPDIISSKILEQLEGYADAVKLNNTGNAFCRMITTKLNVGVDGRFFDNHLTVGVLSKTMLYNGYLNEEVTFGVAGKPANWFNVALSYSLLNNGKFSNIGAGLSFMPYDGINFTIAADYIPLYNASFYGLDIVPSRSKGLNVALGFSIVWGTNPKKQKQPQPELEPVNERKALAVSTTAPTVEQVVLATEKTAVATGEATIADRDNDGVPDWEDECPDVAGPAFNKGCPEIKKELRTLLNKAMQGIQFETGKDVIRKSSFAILNRIAVQFIQHPEYYIEVQGHTDNVGKYDLNVELSQRRAQAVMDYLVNAGVSADHMTAKGYGPDKPIADNATKQGQALNRRVEFDIQFEQVQIETIYEHADSVSIETKLPERLPATQDNIN